MTKKRPRSGLCKGGLEITEEAAETYAQSAIPRGGDLLWRRQGPKMDEKRAGMQGEEV